MITRQWSLLFFSFCFATWAQAFEVPRLKGHINDYAQVLSQSTERQLNAILAQAKQQTGVELAVLTVNSLQGLPIEMASIQVVDQWKLGTASEDRGLLLMLASQERKLRIEVGQGLEGNLTDAQSSRIIQQVMVPFLKKGNFNAAVSMGTFYMLKAAAPDADIQSLYQGANLPATRAGPSRGVSEWLVLLFWIMLIVFGGRSGMLPFLLLGGMGGRGGYRGGGGFGGGLGGGGGFSGGGASGGW